jgi:hypothetical protein
MFKFKLGDRVQKKEGYAFVGYVVANFVTCGDARRIVVESETSPGLLHIFNEEQMRACLDFTKNHDIIEGRKDK